jgi:clathrin heavy chain
MNGIYFTFTNPFSYLGSDLDDAKPVKIFARHQNLASSQIISYRTDASEQWCCLIGIAKQEERIVGYMQLYSVERKISQPLEGHAAAFATFMVEGNNKPSVLFCFASRNQAQAKVT